MYVGYYRINLKQTRKEVNEMKFALFFGNRGFMPAELIEGARDDMVKAVTNAGYDYLYFGNYFRSSKT